MLNYRFALCVWLLCGLCGINSWKQPVVNRLTCQNAFTAHNHNVLEECANQWASSSWVQYSEDSSLDCELCKTMALLPGSRKLLPLLCNFLGNPKKCDAVSTSLLHMTFRKDRGVVLCNVLTVCNTHGYIRDLDFGSDLCSDCKKIIEDIKQLVGDNATSEQIANKLNKYICENLPGGVKDYCENMVKVHIPALLHAIEANIDPMTICSIVGLCQKNPTILKLNDFMVAPKVEPIQQPICHGQCPKQSSYSWISRPSVQNNHMWTSKDSGGIPSCDTCKDVFKQVQTVLEDPKMQSEIKQMVDEKICSNMGFLKQECMTLINHNFDTILDGLLKLNPQEACAIFKMCTNAQRPTPFHAASKLTRVDIPIPGVCKFCEVIVHKLFDMLAANQTEESLYAGMKAVCELLPTHYRTQCTNFVEKYGVQIVKAIIEGTAPALICASFGLCSEPLLPILSVIAPNQMTVDLCTPCKFAVETIYLQLRNNKTEDEIRTALNQVCGLLPAQYTDQCKEYVNAYLDIVIQYMENNLTPEQVCQLLKLCPDSNSESLSERNPCLFGPEFWCSNYLTAKRCGATHYCNNYHKRTYRYPGQNPLSTEPQALCQYMDLSTICVNFDLAKQCERVQDCVAFKLKRYLDVIFEPFKPLENCSVCERIVIRWRLQARILGGAIVNSSLCTTYEDSKKRQCQLVHENHEQILKEIRLETGEPEQICARTIGCKPIPPPTPTKKMDKNVLFPEEFYDKSFNPIFDKKSTIWRSSQSAGTPREAENYFESLDLVNKQITPTPLTVPLNVIKQPLVGTDPCTWGPSYWCFSYKNAEKCPEALEHCRTKVWTNGVPPPEIEAILPSETTKPPKFGSGSKQAIHCCRSANTARRCGPDALKFCMQSVWSNTGKNMAN